jgi:3-mercaptopyruvate sulfurtransferase SseA
MNQKGVADTYALLGGTEGWRKAGFPMEKGIGVENSTATPSATSTPAAAAIPTAQKSPVHPVDDVNAPSSRKSTPQ